LKVVLISCPKTERMQYKLRQFQKMIVAFEHGGVERQFHLIKSKEDLVKILQVEQPDLVFSIDDYTRDDANMPVHIHAILEEMKIPYVGSDPQVLELVLSKAGLKKKWALHDIPTPPFFTIKKLGSIIEGLDNLELAAGYPYILKPNRGGNSRGLDESSIVFDKTALLSKMRELFKTYNEIMVEKYLGICPNIREFTVAMLGNGKHKLVMPARITLKQKKGLRIITTRDKDEHMTQAVPVTDDALRKRLKAFSSRAFEVAGVRDYARCDILFANDLLYAIEINGQPMIPDEWFTQCAMGVPLDTNQYLNAILLAAIARNNKQLRKKLPIPRPMNELLPARVFEQLTIA